MKKPFYRRWWFIVLAVIFALVIIKQLSEQSKPTGPISGSTAKKRGFVKAMDDTLYKDGLADKVEIGSDDNDRIDITLRTYP